VRGLSGNYFSSGAGLSIPCESVNFGLDLVLFPNESPSERPLLVVRDLFATGVFFTTTTLVFGFSILLFLEKSQSSCLKASSVLTFLKNYRV
jgi:hypothetical protein